MRHPSLSPQDVIVLLRIRQCFYSRWTYDEISRGVGLSSSQVHASLQRCAVAGLFSRSRMQVRPKGLIEFLLHGVRYAFPPHRLPATMGHGTASSHPVLAQHLRGASDDSAGRWVWPDANGATFGTGLLPLHPCAARIAVTGEPAIGELYLQLALLDELRVGGGRGRQIASELLYRAIEAAGSGILPR